MLKFSVPIVFALAVLDRYANKKGLVHFGRCGESVARFFEGAALSCAFGDVGHNVPTIVYESKSSPKIKNCLYNSIASIVLRSPSATNSGLTP
jgi:hypothetical protein